jgi:Uma2 family endonuclease
MSLAKKEKQSFSYKEYLTWPEDERWELINGIAYNMSPAPSRKHQKILLKLAKVISDITDKGKCETYIAPFDVRLIENDLANGDESSIHTVVQPDISVICNPKNLDDRGAIGAPDLVVEILSPSTSYKDQTVKLELYEKHQVKEYWIVNGEAAYVMLYRLDNTQKFSKPDYYKIEESLVSQVLGNSEIPLKSFLEN